MQKFPSGRRKQQSRPLLATKIDNVYIRYVSWVNDVIVTVVAKTLSNDIFQEVTQGSGDKCPQKIFFLQAFIDRSP